VKNRQETGLFDGIKPIYRLGIVLLGLFCVAWGVVAVLSGHTNYYNRRGHVVFTPFLILIGVSIIVASIVAWVRNK
jgi:hypothetical protein